MPAKKMTKVKKAITVPREKSAILESQFCTDEEFRLIKKLNKQGAIFIVLGSEHTDVQKFYRGLYQIMYQPTSNGACVYDAHYNFKHAFERPYVTISLNDPCNREHIDNIKMLDRYRSKTLYTRVYEDDEKGDKPNEQRTM